ncbi:MAG: hypothetical protein FIB06_08130 [Betaproteobacteria bacterium]|nr:hypothetical protein [Betaproteobacteria bacterium]
MHESLTFASIPILFVFIGTLALSLLSVEVGYRWARNKQARAAAEDQREKEAPVGAMVGATLGLLAFVLAFTFDMASDAFHARKLALFQEVSAIRICHQQAGVLPAAQRDEVRKILRNYVEDRLHWVGLDQARSPASANALLSRLWGQAAIAGTASPGGYDVFLDSVSKVVAARDEREMVRERSRIPGAFWATLYLMLILSLASMGYHGGVAGTVRTPVMVAVAVSFSLIIVLIADVDSPGHGLINVNQQPMVELFRELTAFTP